MHRVVAAPKRLRAPSTTRTWSCVSAATPSHLPRRSSSPRTKSLAWWKASAPSSCNSAEEDYYHARRRAQGNQEQRISRRHDAAGGARAGFARTPSIRRDDGGRRHRPARRVVYARGRQDLEDGG